jgi:Arc/MetJ family transcription regulator
VIHTRVYRWVAMANVRTNIVLDEELVSRVMKRYGLRTKRETIDFALRRLDGSDDPWESMLQLQGSGWEGDLDQMRGHVDQA